MNLPTVGPIALRFVAALLVSAAATPIVRAVARKIGAVARPNQERWHRKPTAMLGGIAIYAAFIVIAIAFIPRTPRSTVIIAASSALFLVGLVDDFLHLKPYQKLIGQLLGASAVIYFGLVLPWTGSAILNMAITLVWLVGLTNAVNMLDNMDGLAAGVAAIAGIFLGVNFILNAQTSETLLIAAFCGALLGFLIYNHNPASIFMGDCGSLFIGFFLASATLLNTYGGGRSRSVVAVLSVPILMLAIPIFDTTFVTVMRKMAGRAASRGGRDHTSHRLVALGLSERAAVWMLYSFATVAGVLAVFVRNVNLDISVAVIAGFAIVLSLLAVHLAGVRVYSEDELAAAQQKPLVSFLLNISYKRRIFEVGLDVVLISLSYYAAYAFVFGPARPSAVWELFLKTLPLVVIMKLASFAAAGLYRGMWRYFSFAEMPVVARGVIAGAVATVVTITFVFSFAGFSRAVFVLDTLLLLTLVTTTRFAFRGFRKLFPPPHLRTARRALIYGAGDSGELLCRELNNNPALNCVPVGFIDDDVLKQGRVIHGLRVYSGDEPLEDLCKSQRADEILISTVKIPPQKLRDVVNACDASGISLRRLVIEIRPISGMELWKLPVGASVADDVEQPVVRGAVNQRLAAPGAPTVDSGLDL